MQEMIKDYERITGRTSHEVRGLKCEERRIHEKRGRSHLTRGAWIEILESFICFLDIGSRTSHEVRGLKCDRRTY